jgi:tRNA threonylcarbamoyladenosine biosynthesis protein TsaB
MRVLALDTTARALSAAVVEDDQVRAEHVGDATRSHAERLPAALLDVVAAAQIELASIDVYAVAAGPGSFTGLRIGIAAMQGLAFVAGKRIVAVSTLDALAQAAAADAPDGATIAAWIDAHRRDVFAALYRVSSAPRFTRGRIVALAAPSVDDPDAVLAQWEMKPDVFIGSGVGRFAAVIAGRAPRARVLDAPPLAAVIGRVAIDLARAGQTVDPAGVQPVYVRRPDAEIARERNQEGRATADGRQR